MTHWWSGAQGVAVSNPAWPPSMKPLFVPKFASHSQDATSVARPTGASAYEHPEELLQQRSELLMKADKGETTMMILAYVAERSALPGEGRVKSLAPLPPPTPQPPGFSRAQDARPGG